MELTYQKLKNGNLVFTLSGDLVPGEPQEIGSKIEQLVTETNPQKITIDMREATYINSPAIGALLHIRALINKLGGEMELIPGKKIHDILSRLSLCRLFNLPFLKRDAGMDILNPPELTSEIDFK